MSAQTTIAIVGLGYVGLPLAVEFGKKFPTIGFDLSSAKVEAYRQGIDPTGEVTPDDLKAASQLRVTTDAKLLSEADLPDDPPPFYVPDGVRVSVAFGVCGEG